MSHKMILPNYNDFGRCAPWLMEFGTELPRGMKLRNVPHILVI
jgi:hypothetical protein